MLPGEEMRGGVPVTECEHENLLIAACETEGGQP